MSHLCVRLAHVLVQLAVALRVLLQSARLRARRAAALARGQLQRDGALRAPPADGGRVRLRFVVKHYTQGEHRGTLLQT